MNRSLLLREMQIKTTPYLPDGGKKVLAKVWNIWNSHALLLRVEISTNPLKVGLEVSTIAIHMHILYPPNSTP